MASEFLEKNKDNIAKGLNEPTINMIFSPSEIYHENSKLAPSNIGWFSRVLNVNTSSTIRHVISRPFRRYRGYPLTELPKKLAPTGLTFEEIVAKRRSIHAMSGKAINLEKLSKILYIGNGISHTSENQDVIRLFPRTTPSAGALYPIELYCVVVRVNSLTPGIYFYNTLLHGLELLNSNDFTDRLVESIPGLEDTIRGASCCIVMSSVMSRIKFKYGERGYRFALLEAGHIAQNILLAATSEGLGAVPIGGFFDDRLNNMLALDGLEEIIIYSVLIGNVER